MFILACAYPLHAVAHGPPADGDRQRADRRCHADPGLRHRRAGGGVGHAGAPRQAAADPRGPRSGVRTMSGQCRGRPSTVRPDAAPDDPRGIDEAVRAEARASFPRPLPSGPSRTPTMVRPPAIVPLPIPEPPTSAATRLRAAGGSGSLPRDTNRTHDTRTTRAGPLSSFARHGHAVIEHRATARRSTLPRPVATTQAAPRLARIPTGATAAERSNQGDVGGLSIKRNTP